MLVRLGFLLLVLGLASPVLGQDAQDFDQAVLLMKQRKFLHAQIILDRLARTYPDHLEVRNNLAVCLIKAGKFSEAETHLKHVLKAEPARAGSLQNLGVARQGQKDPAAALEHTGKAVRAFSDQAKPSPYRIAHAYYNRGWIQHEQGNLRDATQSYQDAVKLHPQYAKAWLELAIVMAKSGNFADARKSLAEADRWQRDDPDVAAMLEPNRKALDELDPPKTAAVEAKKEPESAQPPEPKEQPAAPQPPGQPAEARKPTFFRDGLFGVTGWWNSVPVLMVIVYVVLYVACFGMLCTWVEQNYRQPLTGEESLAIFLIGLFAGLGLFALCWGILGGCWKWFWLITSTSFGCAGGLGSPKK